MTATQTLAAAAAKAKNSAKAKTRAALGTDHMERAAAAREDARHAALRAKRLARTA